jgi:putative FmdB family regulatory protein
MPTYDYKCSRCGHTFEAFQHITDKPLARCPECKGAVRRMFGGGMGVIFKGSGFYSTDNKKSSALTGGNGGSKDKDNNGASRESEKPAEKPKETSGASSSTPSEKKAAS